MPETITPAILEVSEITRAEWVKYQWIDVTTFGDPVRRLMRGLERTIDESHRAAWEWDNR